MSKIGAGFKNIHTMLFIAFFIVTASFSRERRDKHLLPVREIERPLTLPQRQSRLSSNIQGTLYWDKGTGDFNWGHELVFIAGGKAPNELLSHPSLYIPSYSYGFNDSVQLQIEWGVPTVHFQFLNNNELIENELSIVKASLALFTGLYHVSSMSDGKGGRDFLLLLQVGFSGKFLLSEKLWLDGIVKIIAGNDERIQICYIVGLGFQITDRFSIKPQVDFEQYSNTSTKEMAWYPAVISRFVFNMNRYFGFELQGTVADEPSEIAGTVGATVHFTW